MKKRVTVFATDQNTDSPVFVAYNGKQLYIQQGVETELDEGFINALHSAVERLPGKHGSPTQAAPRFHVTVHGDAERPKKLSEVDSKAPTDKLK